MSKDKLIPSIRFPDFKNEEQWDSTPLDDLCELITKGTTPTTLGYSYTESGVNFIKIESILEGNINLEKAAFISIECNEALKRSQLKEDDVLFSIAGALGVVTTVTKEILPANTNQALSIVRLKNKKQKDYVKAFLKSNLISDEVQKIKAGAAQPNISLNQVANFKILIPKNTKEQQKIASCLSSLDEVIAAHSQKLDVLKDHKKGLMQNLFPDPESSSGVEKVPKYRFKEFENDGEWVEKKMGEVAKVSAGGTPESTNPDYWNGDIPWMNSGELNNKRIYSVSNFITKEGYENSSTKLIPPHCVLIGLAGQGKTRGTAAINYIELCTNQSIGSIHPNYSIFDSEFLYHKIDSMYEILRSLSAGDGGRGGLNLQIIKDIKLSLPSIQEQQKIATCLSSLDALITSQAEKIEQLKMHKKGLMQGLFPKIKE